MNTQYECNDIEILDGLAPRIRLIRISSCSSISGSSLATTSQHDIETNPSGGIQQQDAGALGNLFAQTAQADQTLNFQRRLRFPPSINHGFCSAGGALARCRFVPEIQDDIIALAIDLKGSRRLLRDGMQAAEQVLAGEG